MPTPGWTYSGPFANLTAGTWFLNGTITISSAQSPIIIALLGRTNMAPVAETETTVSGQYQTISFSAIVTVDSDGATYYIFAIPDTQSATDVVMISHPQGYDDASHTHKTSYLNALKIGS